MTSYTLKDVRLTSEVDMGSYSSSRNYFGFCEALDRNRTSAKIIVDDFYLAFQNCIQHVETASSLFIDSNLSRVADEYGCSVKLLSSSIDRLKAEGIVELLDFDRTFSEVDAASGKFDALFFEHETNFRINERPSRFFIEQSVMAYVSIDGVVGRFFMLLPDLAVLVYPHEDMGFGFIFLEQATKEQRDTLRGILTSSFKSAYKLSIQ